MTDLSPTLQLAVSLLAEGHKIAAHLCRDKPKDVADIPRVSLGVGLIDGNGGQVIVHTAGVVACIAYDVGGQLVTSTTTGMPCPVKEDAHCKIGPLALGKDGVPHDAR